MRLWKLLTIAAFATAPVTAQDSPSPGGVLPGGARWAAAMPVTWNGTLLLFGRGYSQRPGPPDVAPAEVRVALLAAGYALAASDYGAGGWALAEAVPAQRATIAAFTKVYGKPKRVIAWGNSMGGLVTTALAEERPAAIDGAVAMCASIGGAVGMMNMALDGASAFRTLVAPDSGIRLVNIDDDRANAKRVADALAAAIRTPQGRARTALAGVLAGIPGWTGRDTPEPGATDFTAQAAQIADSFVVGAILPRVDQEARAGGVFSWTTGVDYRRQLTRSGRRAMIAALYRAAGLDLDADLARLNAAPRVVADPKAVDYMMRHYTPIAKPSMPIVAVQKIGDGQTPPSLQRGYLDAARSRDVRGLWVRGAGHCGFAPETVVASIRYVEARIASGRWPNAPVGFVRHTPAPMLRPCIRGGRCD